MKSCDKNFELITTIKNKKFVCNTHSNQSAKSVCIDCKIFCCMVENCGQPHIYHSIENLEYLVNSHVFPFLYTLNQMNNYTNQTKAKYMNNLNSFKNNLKKFAIDEKKIIDEEHRKIITYMQTIYNSHIEDINSFIEILCSKFDDLQSKLTSSEVDLQVKEMNVYVDDLIAHSSASTGDQKFLSFIGKDVKNLNTKLKGIYSKISKFDFDKEIKETKADAEKLYPNKKEYFKDLRLKFEDETNNIKLTKMKNEELEKDKKSLGKIKKISVRQASILPKDNINLEMDLDIFVRYLNEEINKIRNRPIDTLKLIDDQINLINNIDESIKLNQTINANLNQRNKSNTNSNTNTNSNINTKLTNICDYINKLSYYNISLPPLEWDNDLSNSAEDYLKITQGKIEKDFNHHLTQMKEMIVTNYYSNYQKMMSITYVGVQQIDKILIKILLNENYWDAGTGHNALFDVNYNTIGISGMTAECSNKITLIINLSNLKS